MDNQSTVNQNIKHIDVHYLSLRSILVGAVTAIGLTFLFNTLTTGLGLTLYTQNETGQAALTLLGFIWMLAGGFIMLFVAGWITGRFASQCCHYECNRCGNHLLLGFVMWSTYLLISLLIVGSLNLPTIAGYIGSYGVISTNYQINIEGLATLATFFILLSGVIGSCLGTCMGSKK